MTRYQPTPDEAAAIDLLRLAGYAVVRQQTYARLQERVRLAECMAEWETDRRKSTEKWAHVALDEQGRLAGRLNEVCFAATALGVPIGAINEALDKANQ